METFKDWRNLAPSNAKISSVLPTIKAISNDSATLLLWLSQNHSTLPKKIKHTRYFKKKKKI